MILGLISKLNQWCLNLPFRLHWFFVIFTAIIIPWLTANHPVKAQKGEWYPFSNFPMYSNFEPTAYYVYITDQEDKPVGIAPTFGSWPTAVKKAYDAKLKAHAKTLLNKKGKLGKPSKDMTTEECRPVGDAILKQLRDASKFPEEVKKHSGYRLYQMDIYLEEGKITQKPKLVGEV